MKTPSDLAKKLITATATRDDAKLAHVDAVDIADKAEAEHKVLAENATKAVTDAKAGVEEAEKSVSAAKNDGEKKKAGELKTAADAKLVNATNAKKEQVEATKKVAAKVTADIESTNKALVKAENDISVIEVEIDDMTDKASALNDTDDDPDSLDHADGGADQQLGTSVLDGHVINVAAGDSPGQQTKEARDSLIAALKEFNGDISELVLPDNPEKLKGLLRTLIKDQKHVVAERNVYRTELDKALIVADRVKALQAKTEALIGATDENYVEVSNASMPSMGIVCMGSKPKSNARQSVLLMYFHEDSSKPFYIEREHGSLVRVSEGLYNFR